MTRTVAERSRLLMPGMANFQPGIERYRITGGAVTAVLLGAGARLEVVATLAGHAARQSELASDSRALVLRGETQFAAEARADDAERQMVVDRNHAFKEAHAAEAQECLENLKRVASEGGHVFECIMGGVSEHCTLGQITEALMQSVGPFRPDL